MAMKKIANLASVVSKLDCDSIVMESDFDSATTVKVCYEDGSQCKKITLNQVNKAEDLESFLGKYTNKKIKQVVVG
jgi:hypothetical protein